jgi:hypothetical protein
MNKNLRTVLTAILFLGMTNTYAQSTEQKDTSRRGPEAVVTMKELRATVTDINHKTREVTIQTKDGVKHSFVASRDIRNLDQVKKGDVVVANFSESIVSKITKNGGEPSRPTASRTTRTARPGEMPGRSVTERITTSALVSAMDLKEPSVTFKNSAGDTQTLKVDDAEELKGIKVGDRIDLVYSEAIAIRVEKDRSKQ